MPHCVPLAVWCCDQAVLVLYTPDTRTMPPKEQSLCIPGSKRDVSTGALTDHVMVQSAASHVALGDTLFHHGEIAKASESYRNALLIESDNEDAWSGLAAACLLTGDFSCATGCYEQLLRLRPESAAFHCGLANAVFHNGCIEKGVQSFEHALALSPDCLPAKLGIAFAHLITGDWLKGWQLYESRLAASLNSSSSEATIPLWRGEDVQGKTMLVQSEQGLGDTIQFVRYIPLLAARGAHVTLEIDRRLRRLCSSVRQLNTIIVRGEPSPTVQIRCHLLSLPGIFKTTLSTIPAQSPYLNASPASIREWSQRIQTKHLKVGLAWAGNPEHVRDRQRSVPLAALEPLGDVKGVRFFSLQRGTAAQEAMGGTGRLELTEIEKHCSDMADTAASIMAMDLVISVDTSIAHLAGALGKPVWVLLAYIPDWRWMLGREDSPWYPTARLFRQPSPGQWEPVVRSLTSELRTLVRQHL